MPCDFPNEIPGFSPLIFRCSSAACVTRACKIDLRFPVDRSSHLMGFIANFFTSLSALVSRSFIWLFVYWIICSTLCRCKRKIVWAKHACACDSAASDPFRVYISSRTCWVEIVRLLGAFCSSYLLFYLMFFFKTRFYLLISSQVK
jgi:hypothetical protein